MSGSAFLLLKSTLVLLLLGLALPAQEVEPQISGRVTEAKNGAPIEGAVIQLIPPIVTGQANFQTARTDSKGEYRFAQVRDGVYSIDASRDGFVRQPYKRDGSAERVFQRLNASTRLTGVDFQLRSEAVISGMVTTSEAAPAVAVTVAVIEDPPRRLSPITPFSQTRTDANGHFVLKGLPAGTYFVCVNCPQVDSGSPRAGVWYRERWYKSANSVEGAVPITVGEGEQRSGVGIVVEREKRFNVTVWLSGPDGTAKPERYDVMFEHRSHSSSTQPDGSYLIPGVPAGHYTLMSTAWTGTQYVGQGEKSFDITDADVSVRVYVGGLGEMEGQVKWAGAAAAGRAMIAIRSEGAAQSTPIDVQGHFAFARVLPGRYKFNLLQPVSGVVLRSAACDGKEVNDDLLLQVGDRQKVSCALILATQ